MVSTHMGEISVFTSQGRLWLNGPKIPSPVPLGSALDSDSIAAGNRDAYHIWVNTTSWTKLVSLDEISKGRRPILIDNDPKNRKKAILERKPLDRTTTTEYVRTQYCTSVDGRSDNVDGTSRQTQLQIKRIP